MGGKGKGKGREHRSLAQRAKAPEELDLFTDEQWQPLHRSRWVDEKEEDTSTGAKKTYIFLWENNLLYVQLGAYNCFALPSIEGGLRWGTGGRRKTPPTFTLAEEDAEQERLTWRRQDGSAANIWILEELDVADLPSDNVDPENRALPRSSQSSSRQNRRGSSREHRGLSGEVRRPDARTDDAQPYSDGSPKAERQDRRLWRSNSQQPRSMSSGRSRQTDDAVVDMDTDETYRHLADTTWIERGSTGKDGAPKRYRFYWSGCTLHVSLSEPSRQSDSFIHSFALPSIEGGLRWGPGRHRDEAPRFTLADEDILEDTITWRTPDGEVAYSWLSAQESREHRERREYDERIIHRI